MVHPLSVVCVPVASLDGPLWNVCSDFVAAEPFLEKPPCSVATTQSTVANTAMLYQREACWVKHHCRVAPESVFKSLCGIDCSSLCCLSCVVSGAFLICGLITKSSLWIRRTIITCEYVKKALWFEQRLGILYSRSNSHPGEPRSRAIWDYCCFPTRTGHFCTTLNFSVLLMEPDLSYSALITCWRVEVILNQPSTGFQFGEFCSRKWEIWCTT